MRAFENVIRYVWGKKQQMKRFFVEKIKLIPILVILNFFAYFGFLKLSELYKSSEKMELDSVLFYYIILFVVNYVLVLWQISTQLEKSYSFFAGLVKMISFALIFLSWGTGEPLTKIIRTSFYHPENAWSNILGIFVAFIMMFLPVFFAVQAVVEYRKRFASDALIKTCVREKLLEKEQFEEVYPIVATYKVKKR